ncbi:hypothetical protein EV663_11318 [Rhodovulum bhavnagarense]|uniref:Lipoprotein n=1 Tax=Rhodovulum bhavnagarense TaxID=992286 RepID=A0A4R2R9V5_9RHOB|nr:hypothetical protein [Rhodovulum bhavnagarense]TCP60022.1 hypothetical protein EV663_11318 [Rhodovulum bhavnagarense]
MKHIICLGLLPLVAACASPGPHLAGRAPVKVTVDGSDFSVWHDFDTAQAIRTNTERRPGIMERAYRAIEMGTGCAIRPGTFKGDPALVQAGLSCGPVSTPRK